MTRTQVQFPEPLYRRLKEIADARDWSLAELVRRGMELYVQTCPESAKPDNTWVMPVLRGSGGHLADPATVKSEASAIERRFASR